MQNPKPLLAAIMAVLVLAAALSMVTIGIPEDAGDGEPAPSITVPVGKVGDRASYATYNLIGELVPSQRFLIADLTESTDHDLDRLRAVDVVIRRGGLAEYTESVRLSDRLAFKTSGSGQWHVEYEGTFGRHHEAKETFNQSVHHLGGPSLPWLTWQGMELSLGEEVPFVLSGSGSSVDSDASLKAFGMEPVMVYDHGRVLENGYSDEALEEPTIKMGTVSKQGTLDGEPVMGIVAPPSRSSAGSNLTYWFNERVPYPVLIERTFDPDGVYLQNGKMVSGEDYAIQTTLTDYEPGHTPIPWGEPPVSTTHEMAPRDGLRPADGSGPDLRYPLSQAIADAKQSLLDPTWSLWSMQNPDARLVSATMARGSMTQLDDGSMQWRLVFMGEDDAYEVRAEDHPEWARPVVEGLGKAYVPIRDYSMDQPTLTLSAAVDIWRDVRSQEDAEPDYLHWGLIAGDVNRSRLCLPYESGSRINEDPHVLLDRVRIGSSSSGPCLSDDPTLYYDAITLDIARPGLLVETQMTHGRSTSLDPGVATPRKDQRPPSVEEDLPTSAKAVVVGPPSFDRSAWVAAPLLLVVLVAYFFPAIQFAAMKGFFLLPLFSRIKRSKVLDHEMRDRLHALIRDNPGITPSQMKKETGAGWGTIVHHLAVLERENLVASKIGGRYRRFFLAGQVSPRERASLEVLANHRTQELYTSLLDEPGLATPELAHRIGVTPPGAIWHLKRLEENGLVERRRDGKRMRYYPAPDFRPYDPREAVEVA